MEQFSTKEQMDHVEGSLTDDGDNPEASERE